MKWLIYILGISATLYSNPKGHSTTSSGVEVLDKGALLEITTGDQAIINWDSFSIHSNETTQFIQPSAASAVLNRVVGENLSEIHGTLKANGQVYLVNPNGVLIGETGRIDTEGFVSSVYEIQDVDFLNDEPFEIKGESLSEVINLGEITTKSGSVTLIAHKVENHGVIQSESSVNLFAGHELLLDISGDSLVYISPVLKGEGVINYGSIQALKADLQADSSPMTLAIGLGGTVEANMIENIGGEIYLTAQSGNIEIENTAKLVTKEEGKIFIDAREGIVTDLGEIQSESGEVRLLGKALFLEDSASINVSGNPGGTILVGGDRKGQSDEIKNASYVYVGTNVKIRADAKDYGDGGKVIFWGDKLNWFYGDVTAKGGKAGGNGGFVEVSSPYSYDFQGTCDTTAPHGETGTLLLDPVTITVSGAANSGVTGGQLPAPPPVVGAPGSDFTVTYTAGTVNILDSALISALTTNSIVLDSSTGGGGLNTITISTDLAWSANTLKLYGNALTINGTLTTTGTAGLVSSIRGNVIINSALNFSGSGTHQMEGFGFSIFAPVTLSGSAQFQFHGSSGVFFQAGSNLTVEDSASFLCPPTSPVQTSLGDFNMTSTATINYSSTADSSVTLPDNIPFQYVSLGNSINITSDANLSLQGTRVTVAGGITNSGSGTVSLTSLDSYVFVASGAISFTGSGNLSISSANNVTISSSSFSIGGGLSFGSVTGTIALATSISADTITGLSNANAVQLSSGIAITANNSLDIAPTSSITILGDVSFNTPGALSLNPGGGVVTVNNAGSTSTISTAGSSLNFPSGIDSTATSGVAIQATSGSISLGGSSTLLDLFSATAGSSITLADGISISAGGAVTMIAGTNITAGNTGSIQNTTGDDINLVVDNNYPDPYNYGTGKFEFPSTYTLCTNSCTGGPGKVLLYSSLKGQSTLPDVINTETVTSELNEFVGYWYVTLPPPDPPLFQIMYKIDPNASPEIVQEIEVAVSEPVSEPEQITEANEGSITTTSTPDPLSKCVTPPVAVQSI